MSVPDHCLSFYFTESLDINAEIDKLRGELKRWQEKCRFLMRSLKKAEMKWSETRRGHSDAQESNRK